MHLVRCEQQRLRHGDAERPGRPLVDHQLELGRLLERNLGRLLTLEDVVDQRRSAPEDGRVVRLVRGQCPARQPIATAPDGRHSPLQAELVEPDPIHVRVGVGEHDQAADAVARHGRERTVEFVRHAGFVDADPDAERRLPLGNAAFELDTRHRVGVEQDPDPPRAGYELANELQALGDQLSGPAADARDVAARASQRRRRAPSRPDRRLRPRRWAAFESRSLAASAAAPKPVTSTSRSSWSSSLISGFRRSFLPSAERISRTMFWPSM